MDDADHTFTGEAARQRMAALIYTLLDTSRPPLPGRPPRRTEPCSDSPVARARDDEATGLRP
jgi:hypothetical protein